MKVTKVIFAAVFVLGAAVQFNDPDPYLWIATYSVAAAVCLYSIYHPSTIVAPLVVGALTFVWAIWLSPSVIGMIPVGDMFGAWEMKDINVEKSREMYGLVLITVSMIVLTYSGFRQSRASRTANQK